MKILLGITGSIAAYKTPDLVRQLQEARHEVRIILSTAAQAFITPLTLETLASGAVFTTLFEPSMQHIQLAKWADLFLIAPATAHTLAKLAHGLADDLLTNTYLACQAPLWVAPAMNQAMWQHPATVQNVALLRQRGTFFLGPEQGIQACGDTGPGRMLDPEAIVAQLSQTQNLQGLRILITAGPTVEAIDPVRFISNRSSGKMGYALATAAQRRGATVTLISGPTALPPPTDCQVIQVKTAAEMWAAVEQALPHQGVFIATAAVADYAPIPLPQKLKKSADALSLSLKPTVDILQQVGQSTPKPWIIGFAAESENLIENARCKLLQKGADLIVANEIHHTDYGFDHDDNEVVLISANRTQKLAKAHKSEIANHILDEVAKQHKNILSIQNFLALQ